METIVKLPYPYYSEYTLSGSSEQHQLALKPNTTAESHAALHHPSLTFTALSGLKSSEIPPQSNNSAWARARRSPFSVVSWTGSETPTVAQAWLLLYVLFTMKPDTETLRLELSGEGAAGLAEQMRDVMLAIDHPLAAKQTQAYENQVVAMRSTFWQGAGNPFGSRPIWCPGPTNPLTLQHTITVASAGDPQDPDRYQQSYHPLRPAKPKPGSVIYSRWIPHLKETFEMVALDWENAEHLNLFHTWQNDPRVSQGWNETGTLDQHRKYLRDMHFDPHQVAVLARWNDTFFAYFETYWAKEDRLGGYFDADDFDRGRHSLVGDVRFRGPHRVSAWWSSLMHYLFLDDPRTMYVVGEPKDSNSVVVMYDLIHGFGLDKFVDLPHKRSAFVKCPRWRFFQLCPLGESEKAVGGMRIGLVPKL